MAQQKIAETGAMKDLPGLAFSALDMTAINDAQWPQKPSEAAISPLINEWSVLLDCARFSPDEIDGKPGPIWIDDREIAQIRCPLSGIKRTSSRQLTMSAIRGKADIGLADVGCRRMTQSGQCH